MKKIFLPIALIAAGAMLTFSACNSGTSEKGTTMTQAQMDSAVNAKAAEKVQQQSSVQSQADSIANIKIQHNQDSVNNVMKIQDAEKAGEKAGAAAERKAVRTVRHTVNSNTKNSTPPNSTITKEQQQEQKNKFNER